MFGPLDAASAKMKDLNAREIAYFAPLVVAAFWIGLYPKPVMDILKEPVAKLVRQVDPTFFDREQLEKTQALARQQGMRAMQAPAAHETPAPAATHGGGH